MVTAKLVTWSGGQSGTLGSGLPDSSGPALTLSAKSRFPKCKSSTSERLVPIEPRFRFAGHAEIEQLLARNLLLDEIEVRAAPEILQLHDRVDDRFSVLAGVGPFRRDGADDVGILQGGAVGEDGDDV